MSLRFIFYYTVRHLSLVFNKLIIIQLTIINSYRMDQSLNNVLTGWIKKILCYALILAGKGSWFLQESYYLMEML